MAPGHADLRILPATAALCADLTSWFPDRDALAQWGGPDLRFPLDAAQLAAMLAETATSPPGRMAFAGCVGDDVVAHGQVALDWTNGVARLARFAIAPGWRGTGLARPFLADLFGRVDDAGDFPRLELNVYTFNQPAISLYESLGFEREGVRRSSAKVGGSRWDTAIYAIVRPPRR